MARTSMSNLITTLRGMTNAGTADYAIGTVSYWSDDQLQTTLDRHQYNIRTEVLQPMETFGAGGTTQWFDYQSGWRWLEETDGGTARLIVQDAAGSVQASSGYTVSAQRGMITFTADQDGSTRYLTGYAYDVYGAAADVWRQKSAAYATAIDFSTDNHNVKRSHIVAQCDKMAKQYADMSGTPVGAGNNVTIYRGDEWR